MKTARCGVPAIARIFGIGIYAVPIPGTLRAAHEIVAGDPLPAQVRVSGENTGVDHGDDDLRATCSGVPGRGQVDQGIVPLEREPRVYFGAYLRWDVDDPMDRVFDDFIEYANCASDGYTDLFGAQAVPLDAEGFHVWLNKTGLGLQLLSSLDRLIALIAEPL